MVPFGHGEKSDVYDWEFRACKMKSKGNRDCRIQGSWLTLHSRKYRTHLDRRMAELTPFKLRLFLQILPQAKHI